MRNLMLAGALAGVLVSAPAGAVVTTFASYTQLGTDATLRNAKLGTTGDRLYTVTSGASVTPAPVEVKFNFLLPTLANAGLSNLNATMDLNFTQTGNAAQTQFGFIVQRGYTGNFSFTYSGTAPLVVGNRTYTTGANLLSGSIGGGVVAGSVGGSSGGFSASTESGQTVTFTSDFLDFTNVVTSDLALTLTSIVPGLGASANQSLNSFRASGTGSFSSDPAPVITAVVPEPATWGMMLLGFGLIGAHMRRRSAATVLA